uniref:Cilia and flagella associated protein 70 n=1 Tax=Poecilia latipinna TaxID=48699 RepID=A0A3B3UL60_9TELE
VSIEEINLGESEKKHANPMKHTIDYDFTCTYNSPNDAQAFSDILQKPIIFTVVEVLHEGKKGELKTAVLGQAVVDLFPLLQGQCSFSSTVPLNPVVNPGIKESRQGMSRKQPTLEVFVSVTEPLLTEPELSTCIIMKVTVETAFSVPDTWTLPTGSAHSPFAYFAALEVPLTYPDAWALKGHCHYLQGTFTEARECYEWSMVFPEPPSDTHIVHLRLGAIYILEEKFIQAKEVFLQACEQSPSCLTWLGLGKACYRLGELCVAEEALAVATLLNSANAEVWAYLSLISLKVSDYYALNPQSI